jgi:hypothetical protein
MPTGERRDQHRGWELRKSDFAPFLGAVGQVTTIDPDDAAAAGSTGLLADAGHQHAATAGTPVSVGTANAESSGTGWARDAHIHGVAVPAVRAVWSANTSVPSGIATSTAIAWGGTDEYDTNAMHDPSTNNTRITMPVAGVYGVGGWYQMAADANNSGFRGIYLRVNGATFIGQGPEIVTSTFGGNNRDQLSIYTEWKFAATDYVELIARQVNTVPTALNVVAGAFFASYKTAG